MVGSVGCQVDAEHLKRRMRADLRAATYFGDIYMDTTSTSTTTSTNHPHHQHNSGIPIDAMAVLLSQILYSRRGFPYGCYCILGGLSSATSDGGGGGGQVYVYDAIGSYEQLAIACTGTGFELLQPILDRKFAPYIVPPTTTAITTDALLQPSSSSPLPPQRRRIHRPSVQVHCPSVEEAVRIVLAAYRSVAEREIGVGDHVVLYTVQRIMVQDAAPPVVDPDHHADDDSNNNNNNNNKNGDDVTTTKTFYQSKIWTAPLKKH
jgi:20S proteasome alpha/beta subunit